MKLTTTLFAVALLVLLTHPTFGADTAICPQYKAMDYGNGTAMYYSLRCPDTRTPVGYVQLTTPGTTFMGCAASGCPPLSAAIKVALMKKSPHYEAHKDLKDTGVNANTGPITLAASVPGEFSIEVFHDLFKIALWKDDDATMEFKHKGSQVFAEAIALKITPTDTNHKPLIVLTARQIAATTATVVAAEVKHHESGKFAVEFDCDLPKFAPLRARGNLLLLK